VEGLQAATVAEAIKVKDFRFWILEFRSCPPVFGRVRITEELNWKITDYETL
jgi:hypothetical protein